VSDFGAFCFWCLKIASPYQASRKTYFPSTGEALGIRHDSAAYGGDP
jgi:hypothetical protein